MLPGTDGALICKVTISRSAHVAIFLIENWKIILAVLIALVVGKYL